MTDRPPELSLVIPLKDEALNVLPLHVELTHVLTGLGWPYELIFVNDGSVDGTQARLLEVHARDPAVRIIRFTRNFGQTAAFAAGFAHARGRFIVTSDGDLQNDPADIPRLLQLAATYDVVCGWRRRRRDNFATRHVPSVVANWLVSRVTGIRLHDNGCSLKVLRADVVRPLKLQHGMHRYLASLAAVSGGRVTETVVNHRPRRHGRSKYGLWRTFGVIADLVHFRRLMRQAVDPAAPMPRLYEIAEVLERAATEPATAAERHQVERVARGR